MSNLVSKTKPSKRGDNLKPKEADLASKERDVRKIQPREFPRSYRLDYEVMGVLKNTLDRINERTGRKVSEARLVRALIMLSRHIEDEKIIQALKETW